MRRYHKNVTKPYESVKSLCSPIFFSPSCVIGRSLTFQMLNFPHSKLTIFSNVHRHKMSNKRLNGIQFLRGFAVLAVVLGHNRGTMYDNIVAGSFIDYITSNAIFGVEVFFRNKWVHNISFNTEYKIQFICRIFIILNKTFFLESILCI